MFSNSRSCNRNANAKKVRRSGNALVSGGANLNFWRTTHICAWKKHIVTAAVKLGEWGGCVHWVGGGSSFSNMEKSGGGQVCHVGLTLKNFALFANRKLRAFSRVIPKRVDVREKK